MPIATERQILTGVGVRGLSLPVTPHKGRWAAERVALMGYAHLSVNATGVVL